MNKFDRARGVFKSCMENEYSSFYRNLYAGRLAAGYSLDTEREWQRIPLLSKADIIAVPCLKRIFVPYQRIDEVWSTSGTTASGICTVPRIELRHIPLESNAVGRTYLCFHLSANRQRMYLPDPSVKIMVADRGNLEATAALAARFGIDAIAAPASAAIAIAPHLRARMDLANIRKIQLIHERCTLLQLRALEGLYPQARIVSYYAVTEGGGMIAISPENPPTEHPLAVNPLPDAYVEIIDGDGTVLGSDGDVGELVVTTLDEKVLPLIRYTTGDRARIVVRDQPLFEVIGRVAEERVKIGGGEVVLSEVERVLSELKHPEIMDFEAVVTEEDAAGIPTPKLTITLLCSEDADASRASEIASHIAEGLRVTADKTYADGERKGVFAPLQCIIERYGGDTGRKRRFLTDARGT